MHLPRRTASVFFSSLARCALTVYAVCASPVHANGSDLSAFLERAEKMADSPHPVRADIRISHGTDPVEHAVVIIDPAARREFIALQSSGWRALMPLDWSSGKVVEKPGGAVSTFGADQPLPHTDLRAIDFFPCWRSDYGKAFISDTSRLEKTVTLYAPPGVPYVLFVITFDKETLVPLAVKFYKDSTNNLVRLRRESDIAMAGARPRPRHIEIQDFTENSTTTLDLTWRQLDNVPAGLTDESSFDKANVDWPSAPAEAR